MKRQFIAQASGNSRKVLDMQRQRLARISAWLAASAVLLGVFALYIQPDFLVVLADQIWACF